MLNRMSFHQIFLFKSMLCCHYSINNKDLKITLKMLFSFNFRCNRIWTDKMIQLNKFTESQQHHLSYVQYMMLFKTCQRFFSRFGRCSWKRNAWKTNSSASSNALEVDFIFLRAPSHHYPFPKIFHIWWKYHLSARVDNVCRQMIRMQPSKLNKVEIIDAYSDVHIILFTDTN